MSEPTFGIPVFRQISPWAHLPEYIYSANDPKITDEPGRWLTEDQAGALEALITSALVAVESQRNQELSTTAAIWELEDALRRGGHLT